MSLTTDLTSPLYQKIKDHILENINAAVWGTTDRIPSENELIRQFGISRMTVNRALHELADEGYLVRVVGVGTFVAESKIQVHPLTIRNIAEEIKERGNEHSVEALIPSQQIACWLDMPLGEPCLVITRRTWTLDRIASYALLYHPGSTYKLVGRFGP